MSDKFESCQNHTEDTNRVVKGPAKIILYPPTGLSYREQKAQGAKTSWKGHTITPTKLHWQEDEQKDFRAVTEQKLEQTILQEQSVRCSVSNVLWKVYLVGQDSLLCTLTSYIIQRKEK